MDSPPLHSCANRVIDAHRNRKERVMVVLIFGGTKGIGRALAEQLQGDAEVVVAGRNAPQDSSGLSFLSCDITDPEAVVHTISQVVEWYGRLDVVVNSAGYGHCMSIDEISIEEWDQMNRVTVDGNFYIAKYAYEVFKRQGTGHFIIVGSMASGGGWAKEIGYGTFKGAQAKFAMHLMDQFRSDNASKGTRFACHVICPGSVFTDFWKNIPERTIDEAESLHPNDVAAILRRVINQPDSGYEDLAESLQTPEIEVGPLPPFQEVQGIIKIAHRAHP